MVCSKLDKEVPLVSITQFEVRWFDCKTSRDSIVRIVALMGSEKDLQSKQTEQPYLSTVSSAGTDKSQHDFKENFGIVVRLIR
jgi:hypothetical protein